MGKAKEAGGGQNGAGWKLAAENHQKIWGRRPGQKLLPCSCYLTTKHWNENDVVGQLKTFPN